MDLETYLRQRDATETEIYQAKTSYRCGFSSYYALCCAELISYEFTRVMKAYRIGFSPPYALDVGQLHSFEYDRVTHAKILGLPDDMALDCADYQNYEKCLEAAKIVAGVEALEKMY